MRTWEQVIRQKFGSSRGRLNFKRLLLEKIDSLDMFHTKRVSISARYLLRIISRLDGSYLFYIRSILTRLFDYDPLKDAPASPIEMHLLVARKDLRILPYSIAASLQSTTNEIKKITIVCPEDIRNQTEKRIDSMKAFCAISVEIETDEEILTRSGIGNMQFSSSVSKMEIIKICITNKSSINSLIVDADTLLLRKRNWLAGLTQITPVAQEYLFGHNKFLNQLLGKDRNSGLGFVTHHGLLRGEIVTELVSKCGGVEFLARAIDSGVKIGWSKEQGFPSEWQLYGEFIVTEKPSTFSIPAAFINLGVTRNLLDLKEAPSFAECCEVVNTLRTSLPKLGSLSLHAYKDS